MKQNLIFKPILYSMTTGMFLRLDLINRLHIQNQTVNIDHEKERNLRLLAEHTSRMYSALGVVGVYLFGLFGSTRLDTAGFVGVVRKVAPVPLGFGILLGLYAAVDAHMGQQKIMQSLVSSYKKEKE
jgi:hypothetical protein